MTQNLNKRGTALTEPGRKEANSWYGKDQTKWSKIPSQRGRTPAHNRISVLPGLRGAARQNQPSSPLESWQLLLPDFVLEEIVDFTNKKDATARGKYKRFKRSRSSRTLLTATFVKDTNLDTEICNFSVQQREEEGQFFVLS
ncbi:hypothetical protein ILUMI_21815 [Ignelater luminosus]|uniref:Uncharacterized protein n=1 Tax=Ignelater luminosus TaxID=2038154 RepID=A0A8K0CFR0_IGNLU|nr:hypothetical protein ILUMI_21815 [Ignelater luminosus]